MPIKDLGTIAPTLPRTVFDSLRVDLSNLGWILNSVRHGNVRYFEVVAPGRRIVFCELSEVRDFARQLATQSDEVSL